jgi:hypothetical protein
MTTRQTGTDDAAGVSRLLEETADSLRELIGDHLKLARIELATDARIYAGALGVSLIAALLLLVGYLFAWGAAACLMARSWGAPAALGVVAGFHLTAGALSLGAVSRKVWHTKVMRETVREARRSVRTLVHPIEGQAAP